MILLSLLNLMTYLSYYRNSTVFDKNLNFTADAFKKEKVHFLDSEIVVYRQSTHTGQCTNFHSFEPWSRKTAWIKFLFCRAVRMCSDTFLLNSQIANISKFMAWSGFSAHFQSAVLRKLKLNTKLMSRQWSVRP